MRNVTLFQMGFRPFFLGAILFSIISVFFWYLIYSLGSSVGSAKFSPIIWHAHEMIYGYALAVVAGFLLTAVRNWTGIQTLNGWSLLGLFSLWCLARVFYFFLDSIPFGLVFGVEAVFLAVLILSLAYPIVKAKKWKQLSILSKLVLLLICQFLFYLDVIGKFEDGIRLTLYFGLYLNLALIFVIARRVFPFFTRLGVKEGYEFRNFVFIDLVSLFGFFVFAVADVYVPEVLWLGWLSLVLAVSHAVRLFFWWTPGITKVPLLWVLYLGYVFLIAGFLLKFSAVVFGVSPLLYLHAFAYGGLGLITLGMMARVSWGHTGRNMRQPPRVLFWVFTILILGAVVRVFLPVIFADIYLHLIMGSQVLWMISFSIFFIAYAPILLRKRIDGQVG